MVKIKCFSVCCNCHSNQQIGSSGMCVPMWLHFMLSNFMMRIVVFFSLHHGLSHPVTCKECSHTHTTHLFETINLNALASQVQPASV